MSGIARVPWWLWIALAGLSFFIIQGAHALVNPALEDASRYYALIDAASIAGAVMCMGAAAYAFMNRDSVAHIAETRLSSSSENEQRITWGQFELLAVEAFRRRGFQITERGSSGDDGARNLQLTRGRQVFIAHCKAWRKKSVDIGSVRELYSMVIVAKAAGGIAITTGSFTQEARTFAAGRQLQLIDGPTLREMLRDAEGQPTVMPTIIPTDVVTSPSVQQR